MNTEIASLRQAARELVRELHVLEGHACCGSLSLSEGHFLLELKAMGEATAKDLSERLVLDKSTISRLCSALQKKGLISCCEPSGDRRRKPLRLTESGSHELDAIDAMANEQVASALGFVTDAEKQSLLDGMNRYGRALRYARLSKDHVIRKAGKDDNPVIARIIREVMTEFGAVGEGYSIEDAEIDDMHAAYSGEGFGLFVIERDGRILGCGGYGPLLGGPDDTCELRKMYFTQELRGLGLGTRLLKHCLDAARDDGFERCYLETIDSMHHARKLYERYGFEPLNEPLGETGHSGCNRWMARYL